MPGSAAGILADRLRKAAVPVRDEAKHLSSWSSRIPASIRLQGGMSRITVAAGNAAAPHAKIFELGGRHPVYGHGPRSEWTWVRQSPRPYLRPAVDVKQEEMLAIFAGVVDDWCKQLGYR
jgi:hypothetical protein